MVMAFETFCGRNKLTKRLYAQLSLIRLLITEFRYRYRDQ